jgi:hypothetical protein
MEKKYKNSILVIALSATSAIATAGVEFNVLDSVELNINDGHLLRTEVANDGTIFSLAGALSANKTHTWNKNTGYMQIEGNYAPVFGSSLSNDGKYMVLRNFDSLSNEYFTPTGASSTSGISQMSGNGKLLMKWSHLSNDSNPHVRFFEGDQTGVITLPIIEPTQSQLISWAPVHVAPEGTSETGDRILVTQKLYTLNPNQQQAYFVSLNSEVTAIPHDFQIVHALSDDGKNVLGTIKDLTPGCSVSNVVYNEDNGLTEIGCTDEFTAYGFSGDGQKVIGYKGNFNAPTTSYVWDAVNGARDLKNVLMQNGVNVHDWTAFKATDISEDGLKITGYGTNANGQTFPFLMEVVTECTSDF